MGLRLGETIQTQQAALDRSRQDGFTGAVECRPGEAGQFLLQKSRSATTNGFDVGLYIGCSEQGVLTRLGVILDATQVGQGESSEDVAKAACHLRDVLIDQFGVAHAYMDDIKAWSMKTPLQRHIDAAYLALWQQRKLVDGSRVYPDVAMFTDDLAAYGQAGSVVAYVRSQQNGVVAVVELYGASHSRNGAGESTREWIQRVFKTQPA